MRGSLNYLAASDFDPQGEIRALRDRVAAEGRHNGYMSAIRLLLDLAMDGYLPHRDGGMLERTAIEDIFVFEDSGVRLGFCVPGNGRHTTPDIALLGAEFCPLDRAQRAASREPFARTMYRRYKSGTGFTWPLARHPR
jgi:hypothetical protein